MTEERLDYAVLISLSMREEAEVMASALRAEGIDAFVGNRHHANVDWGWIIAFGGMQVFVPRLKIDEAKTVIRARISEAAEHPEGEAVQRRDRWKAWVVIAGGFLLSCFGVYASTSTTLDMDRQDELWRMEIARSAWMSEGGTVQMFPNRSMDWPPSN